MILKVSNKGQVTIPARLRRRLGIEPDSNVEAVDREGELVIRPLASPSELAGCFREHAKIPMPDWDEVREATEKAIAEEVVNEGRRRALDD